MPGKDFEELPAWELTKRAKPEPLAVYSGPIQSRPSPSHFSQQQDFSHSNSSRNVPASGRPRPNQHHSNGSNFQHRSDPPADIPSGNSGKSSSRPQGTSEICNMFNKFKSSTCELPNNKCFYHRLHKCQACHKWGCKSCNHIPPGQVDFTKSKAKPQGQAHVASTIAASSGQSASCANGPGFPQSDQASPSPDLTTILSSIHNSLQSLSVRMEKLERSPVPPLQLPPSSAAPNPESAPGPDSLLQAPTYSYPAITAIPNHLSIPALDLANKHILWTPITSAGVSLPLPIDNCCSLSLVSKAHADAIALKHPHLTFTKLPSSLPVAVANPSSQLNDTGLMQVPIIWENVRPFIFSMLVVPGLAWPILFDQNHLRITKAHTDHSGLKVHFADLPMDFTVTCRDTNPLDAFPPLRNGPSSANITCLLTAMPSPAHPSSHICLHCGFNLVTLCLVMTSSLVGSTLFSSPKWLEGLQVISGPFDMNVISSGPSLDEPLFLQTEGHNYPRC